MVVQQLRKDGFSKPLAISHQENLVEETNARVGAIKTSLNNAPYPVLQRPDNASWGTVSQLRDAFLSGGHDSLISLGGLVRKKAKP
jgi:hypothetical protein